MLNIVIMGEWYYILYLVSPILLSCSILMINHLCLCVLEKLIAIAICNIFVKPSSLYHHFVKLYVWICAIVRKMMTRCFDVLLVHTTGDTHLLELKEQALDLIFQIISLV